MGSALTTIGLPVALGIIMFGLGLSLTVRDFARVGTHPKAVFIALVCQLVVLPAACFGLVLAFNLPPVLAIGMMLLSASPGGTTANLYSHLFRGDVALNISLTALNSVIAVITLPIITNIAIAYFAPGDKTLGLQLDKVIEVFAIVLLPVVLGMLIRRWKPSFADAMDKPVRITSVIILVVVIAGAVAKNIDILMENFAGLAAITVIFCLVSLSVGYWVPQWFGVRRAQAVASAFEIGVHNATLAIVIAQTALGSLEYSLPAAVYGVLMFFVAAAFGFAIRGKLMKPDLAPEETGPNSTTADAGATADAGGGANTDLGQSDR